MKKRQSANGITDANGMRLKSSDFKAYLSAQQRLSDELTELLRACKESGGDCSKICTCIGDMCACVRGKSPDAK